MEGGKNVKVIARFRPENENEQSGKKVVSFDNAETCKVEDSSEFTFDRVFDMDSTQQEVFEYSLNQTVDDLMNGYNGTVFAYGQTGSGKSYTMMGPDIDTDNRGAIPRMVDQIFDKIQQSPEEIEYMVRVSYMEIYMERIRDLLSPANDNLAIHEDKTRGIHVKNLTEEYVTSGHEVYNVMKQGARLRAVASTNMNSESSRSHSIFMVVVSQKNISTGTQKTGQLFLVDLAGSEKVGKTGASGQTLEEAKKINKSLSALGNVINALTDGKSTHIPYRDSKLTRILQESLGGNSRTSLIVNCSPSSMNVNETLSTLRFGVRAKTIKNKARVNTELSPTELRAMLKKCQVQLDAKTAQCSKLEHELREFRGGEWSSVSSPRSGTPVRDSVVVWEDDEVMKRENELQDQIAERDGVIERQERELEALRSQCNNTSELERLKFEKQELEVRLEAMQCDHDQVEEEEVAKEEGSFRRRTVSMLTPDQSPTPDGAKKTSEVEKKRRKMTADMLGDFYQKSQPDLLDDALNALSQLSETNQETVLEKLRGSLERMQQMPEFRYNKIMEEDRASFQTLVDESEGTADEIYSAKIRSHEDTIVKLMDQVEELTCQNNNLHQRLTHSPSNGNQNFEQVKQSLMADLQSRCEKIVQLEIELDQARDQYNYAIRNGHNKSQQKKMALLERNLEQLTHVQKQLVTQNTQLKKEAAIASKLLTSRNDRITSLEQQLQDTQTQLQREHDQFSTQLAWLNDQIAQHKSQHQQAPKIVKPLRGGHTRGGGGGGGSSGMWNKLNSIVGGTTTN